MSDLRKLLDEATPGPWAVETNKHTWGWVDVVGPSFSVGGPTRATDLSVADEAKRLTDARLIALAPDLAAALLEAEEALERLAKLGNGDSYGNSDGNMIARATLTEIRKLTGAQ